MCNYHYHYSPLPSPLPSPPFVIPSPSSNLSGGHTGMIIANGGSVIYSSNNDSTRSNTTNPIRGGGGGSAGRIAIYHSTSETLPFYNGDIKAFGWYLLFLLLIISYNYLRLFLVYIINTFYSLLCTY